MVHWLWSIALAECYLRTGDPIILKNIQEWVDNAVSSQHNDGWAGRGSALTSYGQGHLNAAGTHVLLFLCWQKSAELLYLIKLSWAH